MESIAAVAHTLEIVDFYVVLREALELGGGKVVSWLGEAEARYRFDRHGVSLLLSPDAYCLWAHGMEEGSFFLEWDRGTESITRLAQKLAHYEAYYEARAYRDHFGETEIRPRLLVVVPDARRERKVVNWLARRPERREYVALPSVLVAARESVFHDVLGWIWRRPGQDGRVRLLD